MKQFSPLDNHGLTIDFMLGAKRDKKAAYSFFNKALKHHTLPSILRHKNWFKYFRNWISEPRY